MVGKDLDASKLGKLWEPLERQGLSEYSLRNYRSCLNMLIEVMSEEARKPVSLEWVLCHPERTVQRLCALYPNVNTQKSMLGAVLSVYKHNHDLLTHEAWRKHHAGYYSAFKRLDEDIRAFYDTMEMTDREREGWVPWEEIVKAELELRKTSYASFEHLLLAMYVLLGGPGRVTGCPLRSDFANVRLCQRDLPPTNEESYLNMHDGKLCIKTHKTSGTYGALIREVPRELLKIIEKSVELEPRDYLFVDSVHHQPYVKNSFTKQVNRTLKYVFGKPLTIRLLRQAFISGLDFSNLTPGELRQVSKNMAHSLSMQQGYRRRFEKRPAEAPAEIAEAASTQLMNFRRKKGPVVTVDKVGKRG
jgi:hypothetical protein